MRGALAHIPAKCPDKTGEGPGQTFDVKPFAPSASACEHSFHESLIPQIAGRDKPTPNIPERVLREPEEKQPRKSL